MCRHEGSKPGNQKRDTQCQLYKILKAEVNGAKFFSKIDLKQAYHQLELHPDSRFITTFSTHEGLFRDIQNVLQQNLSDIRGVKNLVDGIIIHDIEGLSLVWGIEHFRMFLIGSEFDVITDHKALESIFNNPRSRPPARIERWMMRLQPFNFKVIYRKGSLNEADYLSRHQAVIEREQITSASAEEYVNYVTNCSVPKSMTLDEIKKETHNDPVLQKVKKCLEEGKWDENDLDLKPFRLCADELTYNASAGILLKNTRLVIPTALQERATKLGHIGHQGIEKTKSLLRENIWYLNMDKRVKEMVDKCIPCQSVARSR
ncbi:Hypothetical predicted protein [Paramuricea clavata]|uniref:Uncharacterized protein n=1 Tax=Paramuricea clavata TaxID=317549 RepID=A0A7D9HPF5_PARCT|nr:Hypothetical predicted protein [Paramuricea clavata]